MRWLVEFLYFSTPVQIQSFTIRSQGPGSRAHLRALKGLGFECSDIYAFLYIFETLNSSSDFANLHFLKCSYPLIQESTLNEMRLEILRHINAENSQMLCDW